MKNSQIIKILSAFTKPELRAFGKFVNSPFYNTSDATTKLFREIKKFYPAFSSNDLTKEKLFSLVYGKRKYSNLLFNKLVSNLIKLSLEYMTVTSNPLKQYSLLKGLRKKQLDSLFRHTFSKTEKELEHENLNEGDTLHLMLINLEISNYHLDIDNYLQFELSRKRQMELTTLYFLERFASNFIEKTNIAVTPEVKRNNIIKNLSSHIDFEGLYEQISGSDLYYKKRLLHYISMILLHKNRDEKFYREIKDSLFFTKLWDVDVINVAYIHLLDFITYKIKSGDSSFFHERHAVYKKIEQDSFASGNVKIIFTFFRNFILSGINTGDFKWSKYVLDKYIDEIEDKGNSGIKYYLEALISFHEGNFDSALHTINRLDLKEMTIDRFGLFFDIRFLKFKVYFELNYIEESLAMIDSFEHFLKKDTKINRSIKPSYIGFVKYYKKLIRCKIKEDYSDIEYILEKIQKEKVNEKKWLLKKIEEMTGNIKGKK